MVSVDLLPALPAGQETFFDGGGKAATNKRRPRRFNGERAGHCSPDARGDHDALFICACARDQHRPRTAGERGRDGGHCRRRYCVDLHSPLCVVAIAADLPQRTVAMRAPSRAADAHTLVSAHSSRRYCQFKRRSVEVRPETCARSLVFVLTRHVRGLPAQGLAITLFIFAVLGNLTYAASIFLNSVEPEHLLNSLPYIIGRSAARSPLPASL